MEKFSYHLGLDIGASSIGWAIVKINENGKPVDIEKMGVRLFNPGQSFDSNSKETPASIRRSFRMIRRQIDRRQKRKKRVLHILRTNGFIPANEKLPDFIQRIHAQTLERYKDCQSDTVPYYLRRKALYDKLEPSELARVFYHLAQRRGFLSNRKNIQKDIGKVKKAISKMEEDMQRRSCKTLAEYLLVLNKENKRMRNHYTSRQMYIDEFEKIYESQRKFHPQLLTDELKKQLFHALFYQRPLKSSRHLIGFCEYEKGKRRCPKWRLEAQEFRLLQTLNSLTIDNKPLPQDKRETLYQLLLTRKKLTIAQLKEHLAIPEQAKINYEYKEDNSIPGHVTNATLLQVFPDWLEKSYEEKEKILQLLASQDNTEKLKKTAQIKLNLSERDAEKFSLITLEEGYLGLSLAALKKLLPHMREGLTYPEAVKKVYGEFHLHLPVYDKLPPLFSPCGNKDMALVRLLGTITNPIVRRVLSEMRHLINAIIARYGKPKKIFIELARDAYFSQKERDLANRNERERNRIKEILIKNGILQPSRNDIEKYRLAEECNWQCPYTGRTITFDSLFGENPEFQVEHIIPLSRSLDNSFANKTLCENRENQRKHNRTPYEAYGDDPVRYQEIKQRVQNFQGPYAIAKYEKFCMTDISEYEDFTSRQLNDTRYASKMAMKYLSLLYGGLNLHDQERTIYTLSGTITAYMRRFFGVDTLLGEQQREDHRHHALDALVVALTTPAMANDFFHYVRRHWDYRPSIKETVSPIQETVSPLVGYEREDFLNLVQQKYREIVPVFHYRNRVRGALHEQTYYGRVHDPERENDEVTIRKPIETLTTNDIDKVIDPIIRQKLQEISNKCLNDNTAFQRFIKNNPLIINGKKVNRVKIQESLKNFFVPTGKVTTETNHHMEIYAILNDKGEEIAWEGVTVSLYEAYQRKRAKKPIVNRNHTSPKGPTRYKFTLYNSSIIEATYEGNRELFVIRTIPQSRQIFFVRICDARKKADIQNTGEWFSAYPNTLFREWQASKVVVTPLGEVRRSCE